MKKEDKNLDKTVKEMESMFEELFGSSDEKADTAATEAAGEADELDDSVVILNDENGNEIRFEFLDLIEYQGEEYVVLLPEDEDAEEVVILKVEDTGSSDEEAYVSVDNEYTLQTIFEIFKEKFRDIFTFLD